MEEARSEKDSCINSLGNAFERIHEQINGPKSRKRDICFVTTYNRITHVFQVTSYNNNSFSIQLNDLKCMVGHVPEMFALYVVAQLLKIAEAENDMTKCVTQMEEAERNIKSKINMLNKLAS